MLTCQRLYRRAHGVHVCSSCAPAACRPPAGELRWLVDPASRRLVDPRWWGSHDGVVQDEKPSALGPFDRPLGSALWAGKS